MSGPCEAALDDIRRRLDQLHTDVQMMTALGRATLSAVATLSDEARKAAAAALAEEAARQGFEGEAEFQAALFEASAVIEGAASAEARLARRLERALIERAAELEEGETELRSVG